MTVDLMEEIIADREQREEVSQPLDRVPGCGIVITDPTQSDNPIIYCNPAFERITGYSSAEVVGRNCRFLQHPPGEPDVKSNEENEAALVELRAALREQRGCEVLLLNYRRNGTRFWNELTLSPVFDREGKLVNYVGAHVDVTTRAEMERDLRAARQELDRRVTERTAELSRVNESLYEEILQRRRVERELSRAERKFRGIFENAVEGIYQSTPQGHYISVNPALARIYGYRSPEELMDRVDDIGKDVYAFPAQRAEFQRVVNSRGAVQGFEYQIRQRDGNVIWISENARVVKDGQGQVLYYEGTIQDITPRKQADAARERLEIQLRQSQKMEAIGTLAGGIAHDFNNILTAIIGFNELSIEEAISRGESWGNQEQVRRASLRARELVRQILAFSRHDAPERRSVSLGLVCQDALKLLRASIPSTIQIKQRLRAQPDTVVADPVQLHQVLMNLCTNASHAMRDQDGLIELELDNLSLDFPVKGLANELTPGSYLKLTVRDNGHGMEPSVVERIFEPFFTTKPVGEGTGLGLAVVHGIIKSHGGDISVTSEPGLGTTFQILLPLEP
ncbi:MAG TPA: PAS domain S-box protein, partial [Verrucomicrobiae bacterium]|nr:PAS domain S-box protein [Verrucomicrobiae bacterium]